MSKLSVSLVNLGSLLHKKGFKRLAMSIWSIPNTMKSAAPVNVKKYLSLSNDRYFIKYVRGNFFKISCSDDLLGWVYIEASKRNLEDIEAVIERGFTYDASGTIKTLLACVENENYKKLTFLLNTLDKESLLKTEYRDQKILLLLGVLFDESKLIQKQSVGDYDKKLLRGLIAYYKNEKKKIPNSLAFEIDRNSASLDQRILYAYCQAVQATSDTVSSIGCWKNFVALYPTHVKAMQNLLLQQCKADDIELIDTYKWLANNDSCTEKVIDQAYRSANRINDLEFLKHLNSFKKKTKYSLKVNLELNRKHDLMESVDRLVANYCNLYGEDKWLSSFKAKRLIDLGLYREAAKSFKRIKGQKVYYAIALLKDKKLIEAQKIFKRISSHDSDYFTAQRFLGDIAFYESSDWESAVKHYSQSLNKRFDYQMNLRRIKSEILSGLDIKQLDFSLVTREDKFYLKYIYQMKKRSISQALASLSQIYVDNGCKPLIYRKSSTFFDSISSGSKGKVKGPLVSVIMTAYKACETIDRAIDSILSQNYENIELIVVEDHSPDETFQYLQSQYNGRITLLKTPSNSGTYVAKNLGMKYAKGELITFMDSDDWSHPERISKQVSCLQSDHSKVACQTGHLRMTNDGDILFRKRGVNLDVPISLMIRKIVLEKIGYFDSVRASGDSEYISRIKAVFGSSAIFQMECPLILARQAENSLTTSGPTALTWAGMPKIRIDYRREFRSWHRDGSNMFIPFNQNERRFSVPSKLMV